ncbi:tetratricopeptide repeat protein [Sphingomonas sp. PB4P5]|uniref:tetratricopeptide repeat protein n=1 Tax=Parasphingomonas puruogangriensis TaxID=3096155 RepID=UPI002FCBAF23
MGWAALALIGAAAALLLWRIGLPRGLWSFVGAALMLGAAGYALQGQPSLAGHPVAANAEPLTVDPEMTALRDAMVGRFRADTAYLVAGDAMLRIGNPGYAVNAILGGIRHHPQSMALWTGLGSALATHDGGQVSPTALFAFRRAGKLAPLHPAPPFFLGLAYVRAGQFAEARPYWARALALAPPGISYRPEIQVRLALLDQFLAETAGAPVGQ